MLLFPIILKQNLGTTCSNSVWNFKRVISPNNLQYLHSFSRSASLTFAVPGCFRKCRCAYRNQRCCEDYFVLHDKLLCWYGTERLVDPRTGDSTGCSGAPQQLSIDPRRSPGDPFQPYARVCFRACRVSHCRLIYGVVRCRYYPARHMLMPSRSESDGVPNQQVVAAMSAVSPLRCPELSCHALLQDLTCR
jgi:hypothetical protein